MFPRIPPGIPLQKIAKKTLRNSCSKIFSNSSKMPSKNIFNESFRNARKDLYELFFFNIVTIHILKLLNFSSFRQAKIMLYIYKSMIEDNKSNLTIYMTGALLFHKPQSFHHSSIIVMTENWPVCRSSLCACFGSAAPNTRAPLTDQRHVTSPILLRLPSESPSQWNPIPQEHDYSDRNYQ